MEHAIGQASKTEEPAGERIGIPRVGDVIVCAAFKNGWRRKDEASEPLWVTDATETARNDYEEALVDESRGTARFVVEESFQSTSYVSWTEYRKSGYGGAFEWEEEGKGYATCIVARRLADDGSYAPTAETVRFNLWGYGVGDVHSRAVREVRDRDRAEKRYAIMDAPTFKIGTMARIVRFE